MMNQNPKPYFNQVAMVESQYESKRKMTVSPNSASLLQNKSPLRQRENTNSINTPSRVQIHNGNKASLSPLRSKRNDTTTTARSTAISRRKLTQYICENHNSKPAKFAIEEDSECFYFCERCAIPLISNGFKLMKIHEDQQKEENPRIKEINQFLKQLQIMDTALVKKKQSISDVLTAGQKEFQTQLSKVEEFYSQFYCIIDQHKQRVIEEAKVEYQKATHNTNSAKKNVESAIRDSASMRQDILASMNSVILQVMDHQFRSVMSQYYGNLNGFRDLCNSKKDQPIKVRTLSFKDGEATCQNLIEGLVVQWDDDTTQQEKEPRTSKTEIRPYNSQSRSPQNREQQQSDRENPIECLETSERGNSNAKQLGGLFCSFDE